MELACIRAILERTASQPSSPACEEKERKATLLKTSGNFSKQFEMICISQNPASHMAFAKLVINDNILSDTSIQIKLFVTTLVFSKQTHFIWSRTELLGRCDIAVVYVSAGTGVGTRSSRDPSVRMVGLVGSHTHLTHLALKLRKRRMWMKQTQSLNYCITPLFIITYSTKSS